MRGLLASGVAVVVFALPLLVSVAFGDGRDFRPRPMLGIALLTGMVAAGITLLQRRH